MPVLGMNVRERPGNASQAEAASYLRIFIDVGRIIVVNEVVPEGLTKNNPCNCREKHADADSQPATVGFRQSYWFRTNVVHAALKFHEKRPPKISVRRSEHNSPTVATDAEHRQNDIGCDQARWDRPNRLLNNLTGYNRVPS